MVDHLTLNVSAYEASKSFYEAALAALGYELKHHSDEQREAGFVADGPPSV